jgi:RNA 2',3'-cyclic 3'-phosphodiesterase
MSKVYTSAVVIIPPEDEWILIQQIRKLYDWQINRWMPHITLLYPFRPEHLFNKILGNFKNTCKNITSFNITLKEIKSFTHGKSSHTIWLSPEPIELIKELQEKLLKIVPDCDDVNKHVKGYTPHLSIGQLKGSKDDLSKIINQIQENWKPIVFLIEKIAFISREKEKKSRFQIKKEIFLK